MNTPITPIIHRFRIGLLPALMLCASVLTANKTEAATPAVSAGDGNSLFLKTDGSVWGTGDGSSLGIGTLTDQYTPVEIMTGVRAISAGAGHSLFIKTDSSVWATGANYHGQIGDGTSGWGENPLTPVQVITGGSAISAGVAYSLFLKTDGSVWATGLNDYGELGDGTTTERHTPVQVMTGVKAISAGSYHSLFIKTDGSVWGTGMNESGQLGDGTTKERHAPVQVMTGVKAISAGTFHSLFLKTDGSVWATGSNYFGGFGDGTTTERHTPVQVMTGVKAIAADSQYSLFLKTDGSVWAAGYNGQGQLGDGTTTNRYTPVKIMNGVRSIDAEDIHSLFLKADGTVWTAGAKDPGYHGDGTLTEYHTPVEVIRLFSIPIINVQQPVGTNIPDAGSKRFGSVTVGSGKSLKFIIKNTGTANLTGLAITKRGVQADDFTVADPTKTTIPPGSTAKLRVSFKPAAKGSCKAALRIESNEANPFDIKLTGTGL